MNKSQKKTLKTLQGYLMTQRTRVFVTVGGKRRIGEVIGVLLNTKTIWVRIKLGAKSYYTIKRHIKKHNVVVYKMEDIIDG